MVHRIRDPIHGFIHFSEEEKNLINRPEFQRLRFIKQLALTYYVYPGAMHSRFEHSLGVMELASRMFEALYAKEKSLIEQKFKSIDLSIDQARSVLRLAALLHDIGHLPFSHGGEVILPEGVKHEDVSIAIIKAMKTLIDKLYFDGATDIATQLIKKENILPELGFLRKILSGEVDADRMDYLLRDSHHCGVSYGNFDYLRLIESLAVINGYDGGLDLAIDYGGIHTIEALILARYYMFTQVYCHRTRRIYDIYLEKFMQYWKPKIYPLTEVPQYDDVVLMKEIRDAAFCPSNPAHSVAKRIYKREHHSVVYETEEFTDPNMRRKAKEIYKNLVKNHPDYDFIIDDKNAKGTIHKFLVPKEDQEGEEFWVVHKQKKERLITEESEIIKRMPRRFHVVRIYVDQKDGDILETLRKEAQELEKEVR